MVIHVGGVNGVGKTTVLKHLSKIHPEFLHVKGSYILMEALKIPPGDYETLRSIPDITKVTVFGELIWAYSQQYVGPEKVVLIDAHYLNIREGQVFQVVGDWIRNVDGLVLIEADLKSVISRVVEDHPLRNRGLLEEELSHESEESTQQIERYISRTREEFWRLSEKHSLPAELVINQDGELQRTSSMIVDFCR